VAERPRGSEYSLIDPFAEKRRPWKLYLVLLIILGALLFLWREGHLERWWTDLKSATAIEQVDTGPEPAAPALVGDDPAASQDAGPAEAAVADAAPPQEPAAQEESAPETAKATADVPPAADAEEAPAPPESDGPATADDTASDHTSGAPAD
jgi:hypothetical protein